MDVFVARQPIFDRNKEIYAYELLFRSGQSNGFPQIDGNVATTSLLSSSFFTVGIDKVGAGRKVFINFTEELIANNTPQLFSAHKLVVEILEDVNPGSDIVAACQKLKEQDYELALDDFVYSNSFDELLQIADIIKIDFRLTPVDTITEMLRTLSKFSCRLLAEKVETYEEFAQAVELGFDYFQGYFFSKPEVLKNKDVPSSKLGLLQLVSEVNSPGFDVKKLERIVAQDVSITYKLMNYINSAHFARVQPLSSIKQAISFIGERDFKLFVSLIATSKLAGDKPDELLRTAIVRANFLQLLGREVGEDGSELFLLGLFSCLDAMLDLNIENILKKMHLTKRITSALVDRGGDLFIYLRLVEAYEAGNWVSLRLAQKKISIDGKKLTDFYLASIARADAFI